MTSFSGVLFDNDGTLIDTHDLILSSMRHATRTVLGEALPDAQLMAKVGQPLAVQMKDFSSDPAIQETLLAVYREHNHAHHDAMVRAFPGIEQCLSSLAAGGVKLGVVISKMHALAWHGLQIMQLAPYLSCCIGADDTERHKPDPQPVCAGLERLGLEPQECLYVGDSPFDMQAGRGAGCKTVAVTWGMFPEAVLRAEDPNFIIHHPDELPPILGL